MVQPDGGTMNETGFDFLKWGLVLAAWPIWAPFARALWKEFQKAMRPEGGLTGPVPSPSERRRIEAEIAHEEPSQVHESIAHHKSQLGSGPGRQASAGTNRSGQARETAGPAAGNTGRTTFRRTGQASRGPQRPRFR
jgi:hypothetical protein